MRSQKKAGALLLYVTTILNTFISIFLTPLILSSLGDAEYGVYRTISALTGQLALVSIGIGTITTVYVARFNVRTDDNAQKEKENFLAIAIFASTLISIVVLILGGIIYFGIDGLYGKNLDIEQLQLMKRLYRILVANVAIYLFRDVFVGIVNGNEKFLYSNSVKLFRLVVRALLIIAISQIGLKSVGLVLVDLFISIAMVLSDLIYCFGALKIKVKFYYFDKVLFKSMFTFSLAIFLQAIVNQVNQNLDSVILGAMITPSRVAVYSLALTLYVAFNSLSSAISTLFTPEASKLVQRNATTDELTGFCVKVGRYQLMVTALLVGGFISVGQQFVSMWVGNSKADVYLLTIILILPMSIVNVLCGANSVLDAYMKRMGRSLILIGTAAVNVVSSIFMIQFVDYWGAALGTAISVVVGQILFMSVYYKKVFGFSMIIFQKSTFKGIIPVTIVATICTIPINLITANSIILLGLKGCVFVAIYSTGLLFWGLNSTERKNLLEVFHIEKTHR